MQPPSKVNISAATGSAVAFVNDAFPETSLQDLRLEEADRSNKTDWLITLSWLKPQISEGITNIMESLAQKRIYKVFVVDSNSGEVKAMKIREIE